MDITDVLTQLQAMSKPYIGIMNQSTFANNIKAIKYGFAKPKTAELFLSKFGYKPVKQEQQWEKQ